MEEFLIFTSSVCLNVGRQARSIFLSAWCYCIVQILTENLFLPHIHTQNIFNLRSAFSYLKIEDFSMGFDVEKFGSNEHWDSRVSKQSMVVASANKSSNFTLSFVIVHLNTLQTTGHHHHQSHHLGWIICI